jgi:hypothetical protein
MTSKSISPTVGSCLHDHGVSCRLLAQAKLVSLVSLRW